MFQLEGHPEKNVKKDVNFYRVWAVAYLEVVATNRRARTFL